MAASSLDHVLGQEGCGALGGRPSNFQEPIFARGFGFWLDFGQDEGKMRVDLPSTYGGEPRGGALCKHTCITFVEHSLYGPICHTTLDRAVCELVHSTFIC